MVIPEWWTWWRWLVHSPIAWKASHKGLKALTLVPNPIRISPQMQVTCGWKRILMHKHYNMSMYQYFLYFVTLFGCFDYRLYGLKFVCLFLHIFILFFFFFFGYFWSIFSFLCVKNPKTTLLSFVSKLVFPCTFLLMDLCIYERSLFLCTLITVEEILKSMWLL